MRYGVLGPVEVRNDDRLVSIGGMQQQRLLAALLSQPGAVVTVPRLVDAVWPDGAPPDGAEHSVRTYVHRLRSAIGDAAIATDGAGYALRLAPGGLDAAEFEQVVDDARHAPPDAAVALYDRALGLWRGPAFGSLGAEWWALPVASRLDELRTTAAEERAAALLATGMAARAIPDLQALTAGHPDRERPVALLASALHAVGRDAEALRRIHDFRSLLGERSGLEPSTELVELERAIAAGETPHGGGWPLRGYVIHELLGEGSSGRVYAAVQPGTNRRVAIKVIRPGIADTEEFVRRFEAEAQVVARLEHPHIVPLYDFWREPGAAYLVFRLLTGTADAALVTGGPWSTAHVSGLVEQVGGALVAAHAAGVTHGDIGATNVLLDETSMAYLADFGLATASEESFAARVTTDIRALAGLLWKLLTGVAAPAEGGPLPSLTKRIPDVPADVDAVLAAATAVEPRLGSVAELILAWRAAVGRPEGVLSPVDGWRSTSSGRRLAASQLIAATSAGRNPYLGLRPFDEADADRFFGRRGTVDALRAMVAEHRVVAVVGPSGSGKSSAVFAGLVPALRADGWRIVAAVPGEHPVAALRNALTESAVERLHAGELVETIAEIVRASDAPLAIVVDQFEECWTMAEASEREELVGALIAAANDTTVRVCLVVRADFYDRPLQHPVLGAHVAAATFPIPPMSAEELEDAIVLPSAGVGVAFDDGVVATLVSDAAAHPATLPMLQFTLAELYTRRVDGRITAAALRSLGGIAGAVGRRAEEVYAGMPDVERPGARELFARLITPGEGAVDTRRRARLGELTAGARATVDRFVAARLLVGDHDPATREPVVEVAHEALLSHWPRLREWVDEDRQWLAQVQHLAGAARAWDAVGRPATELYRGSRLEAAIEALPAREGELTPTEIAFVRTGQAARDAALNQERRAARRLRRLLVIAAIALVVALLAGSVAFVQRNRSQSARREAEIEALVGRINTLRPTQRDTAALLAVEAYRLADTPRTRSALLSTFTSDPGYLDTRSLPDDSDLWVGIVLPDGERALVVGRDHLVRPYDLATGVVGEPWPSLTDEPLRFTDVLSASADGRVLAHVADADRRDVVGVTIAVYDVNTGTPRFTIDTPLTVGNATLSPDGSLLAVSGGAEETVILLDTIDGHEVARATAPAAQGDDDWSSAGLAFVGADRLAIGSAAGPVRIVAVPTLQTLAEIDVPDGASLHLDVVDDGRLLAHGWAGTAVLDLAAGTTDWFVDSAAVPCDRATVVAAAQRLYCSDAFGRLTERDLADGRVTRRLDNQNGSAGSLWPAAAGAELVVFGNNAPLVTRWQLDGTGPIARRLPPGYVPMAYSPDSRWLATLAAPPFADDFGGMTIGTAGLGGELAAAVTVILDADTGAVSDRIEGFSPTAWRDADTLGGLVVDGDRIALANYHLATRALDVGELQSTDDDLIGGVDGGGPRAWGFFVVDDRDLEVRTFDTTTGAQIEPTIPRDEGFTGGDVSPDGTRLAIGRSSIRIYDTATGAEVGEIELPDPTLRGVHYTDGGVIVAWSLRGEISTYDAETLAPLRTLSGNRGYILSADSDASGTLLATIGGDRSVALHDIASGVALGDRMDVPGAEANAIALRPDGAELAVGGWREAGIQVWDLDPEQWVAAACRLAGRNLTAEEWSTNLADLAAYRATCPEFVAAV